MPVVGQFARGGSNAGALEDALARERSGDRRPACGDSPSPWLETEHDGGIGLAVEHVVELGQERIALRAGPKGYDHVQRRLAR